MEYKKFEYPSFNIHTIKTNKFKTVNMEIIFREEAKKEEALAKVFLADIMSDCSYTYKSRREMVKKLEELYQANFYGVVNKVGNVLMTSFVLSFLNPRYVNDKEYLDDVLSLPFKVILNPFIEAEEFDIKNFKIVKNRLHDDILSINEDIGRMSLKKALSYLDNNSPSSYGIMGSLEELESITPKTLYDSYKKLINSNCDIFIVGDIDMEEASNIIFKYFKNPVIKTKELNFYVNNEIVKKERNKSEKSSFVETNLVNIYNIKEMDTKEKNIIFYFYNYLLGGGGLNTKLYQLLREKNSLCYGIKSIYLKYDNLLLIQTDIAKKDLKKAKRLINQGMKELKEGKFSLEELENAKESFIFALNLALDSPSGIINNYVFHVFDELPLVEDRIKLIKNVKKEDIIKIASKIKPNLSFVLEGKEQDGEN